MAFFSSLIGYLFKMVIIGAVAFCGILLGKKLRDNKDAKTVTNTDAEQSGRTGIYNEEVNKAFKWNLK